MTKASAQISVQTANCNGKEPDFSGHTIAEEEEFTWEVEELQVNLVWHTR